ncbi:hypothetical protein [Nesterenkonia haasae]|uniref:hypothetical protein n=1 Tax=Nesterenkonia haasae TaxID=2587813 RepID=UPI001390EB8F|nr:hypothetical protein [Nesterenkonia haasae]NDK31276.1 hypothetical protein [Nesterenkonia haasae]
MLVPLEHGDLGAAHHVHHHPLGDNQNRQLIRSMGVGKVARAPQEVADTLDGAHNLRSALDRAYEIGLQPAWDGSVNFELGSAGRSLRLLCPGAGTYLVSISRTVLGQLPVSSARIGTGPMVSRMKRGIGRNTGCATPASTAPPHSSTRSPHWFNAVGNSGIASMERGHRL